MEFVVRPKTKTHYYRTRIGQGKAGHGMQGHGIWKHVNNKAQKESQEKKQWLIGPYGVPIEEQDINHGIDKTHEVKPVENHYLGQNQ